MTFMAEMAIKKRRPKNLDLPTIRLPLPGILSIIHRISGAGLFLLLPFLLWLFQSSLTSPETFASVKGVVGHPLAKIVLLGLIWFYMHHFCAGIRYLLLDLHKGLNSRRRACRARSFSRSALR
jgi:succinate dehydrogenase / fumarate reductase cytochrome b subunit